VAGRTYIAGQAAVVLVPHSAQFHNTARRELATQKLSTGVNLVADAKGFRADARERLSRGPKLTHKVHLVADTTGFKQSAQARLDATRLTVKVAPKFDSASPELTRLKTHLESMKLSVTVKVNLDTNGYEAKLAALTRTRTQRIRVDVDQDSIDALREALDGVSATVNNTTTNITRMGRNGTRVMRPLLYSFVALAAVSLIPLIGQLTQALGVIVLIPAMAASAVAGLAALAIGFSGIGKAFTAKAPKVTDTAGAQNRQASALRSMAAAERSLAGAQRSGVSAQKRLNDERKMAVRRLRDMNDELDSAVLNEEDARIAIIEAQNDLNQAYMDGDTLGIRKGQNAVRQAEEGLDQMMKKNQDLRADVEAASKAGVEGDEQVVAAKEGVLDAQEAILSAQESLLDAQDAFNQSTQSGVAAIDELEEALANLSPSARLFVETVRGMSAEWRDLRLAVQESLFSGLHTEIRELADLYLPSLKEGLSGIATEINGGLKYALDSLMSDGARENLDKIMEMTRISIGPLIQGLTDLAGALGNIATVGSEFLPGIADSFANSMAEFKAWTGSDDGQNRIRDYIAESIRTFDKVWEFLKAFKRVLGAIFATSDEAGETMLQSLTDSMNSFADWMETAEGQARMGEFWEAVRVAITDIMNMIGTAIKLVDKIAAIMDPKPSSNQGMLSNAFGGNSTAQERGDGLGRILRKASGADVEGETGTGTLFGRLGSMVPGLGRFTASGGQWVGDKLDPFIRGPLRGWLSDTFLGSDSNVPDNVYGTNGAPRQGVGQGPRGARDYETLANQLEAPKDLSGWDRFREKVSGLKDTVLGENGMSGWLTSLGETFGGLGDKVGGVGDTIGDKLGEVKDWLGDLKDSAIESLGNMGGSFSGLGTKVGDVLGDIINDKFPWLSTALENMRGWWESVTSGIGTTWATLKEKAAEPINWIIDNVINGALKNAWNAVAKVIPGLKEWDGVDNVGGGSVLDARGNDGGATGYWTGGVVPGYTPGREAILRPEFTRAVGPSWVDEMNSAARRGGMSAVRERMANYAFGGVVDASMWDAVSSAFPNATLNSAYRPGHSGYHGTGGAIDIGGPMQQVADWIYRTHPDSAQLIWGPGPLLYNVGGNKIADQNQLANQVYARDLAGHFDHVHWASDYPVGSDGRMVSDERGGLLSRVGSAASGLVNSARNLASNGLNKALSGIESSIPDFGASMIGSIPKDFFGAVKNSMLDAVRGSAGTSASSGNTAYDIGAGAEQWRGLVEKLFVEKGVDLAYTDKYLYQLHRESGGNPNALNDWDINWVNGTPSKGLAQVIDPTFQSFKDPGHDDIWAPEDNLRASINYLLQDPKFGGRGIGALTGAGYDQGGIGNGIGFMPKYTIEPERVLSPAQTASFEKLIPLLEFILPNLKPPGQNDPIPVTITDTGTLNGQPLQGATVGPNGEYIAAPGASTRGLYDVGPKGTGYEKPVAFSTTPAGKTAMSLAGTFGFGNQAAKLQSKEEPLMQLAGGITGAMAAAAGGPEAFALHAANTSAAAAANIGKNFAEYLPSAAGGMAESALSAIAGPLIGTVNTGMSKNEVITTIGDATNRAMRRTNIGRRRAQ
jgi:hypothetical protein